jgi:hypothetical protein
MATLMSDTFPRLCSWRQIFRNSIPDQLTLMDAAWATLTFLRAATSGAGARAVRMVRDSRKGAGMWPSADRKSAVSVLELTDPRWSDFVAGH